MVTAFRTTISEKATRRTWGRVVRTIRPSLERLEDRVVLSAVNELPEPNNDKFQNVGRVGSYEISGTLVGIRDHIDKYEISAKVGDHVRITFGVGTGYLVDVSVPPPTGVVGPIHLTSLGGGKVVAGGGSTRYTQQYLELVAGTDKIQFIVSTLGNFDAISYQLLVSGTATTAVPVNFQVKAVTLKLAKLLDLIAPLNVSNTTYVAVTWRSSTGHLADLAGVTFREKLRFQPGVAGKGATFTPPSPFDRPNSTFGGIRVNPNPDPMDDVYRPGANLTRFSVPGTTRDLGRDRGMPEEAHVFDQHGEEGFDRSWASYFGGNPVGRSSSYRTIQQYQWRSSSVNSGNWQDIGPAIPIVRTVKIVRQLPIVPGMMGFTRIVRYTISLPSLGLKRSRDIIVN